MKIKNPFTVIFSGKSPEVKISKYGNSGFRNYCLFARKYSYKNIQENQENITKIEQIKRSDNVMRAQESLRTLINNNEGMDKFWTLTYKENMIDVNQNYKDVLLFRKRLDYYFNKKIRYVVVPEIQLERAVRTGFEVWHNHLILDAPYIDKSKLEQIWGLGFAKPQRVRSIHNAGVYMQKYLTKESLQKKLYGHQSFLRSRNVVVPQSLSFNTEEEIEKGNDIIENFENNKINCYEKTVKLENISNNPFMPESIKYLRYNLKSSCVGIFA